MKKYFIITLTSVFVSACSIIKVSDIVSAPDTQFDKYKTFGFYSLEASGDTVSKGFNLRVQLLKEAINAQLSKRGMIERTVKPDLLINIGIVVKRKMETRETDFVTDGLPKYVGQRNYSWKSEEIETGRYREGTITIHLVDATEKKLVWKGTVQSLLPEKQKKAQETAQKEMESLFKRYPVPVKGS